MKVLVLGASGMAGHLITTYLLECGWSVDALARQKLNFCDTIIADVRDNETIKNIITKNSYDAVINAVGILNQAAEDSKTDAIKINSLLPHFLAQITKNSNTKIVHMSTDCVFSGKTGGYCEDSTPDGETFYDRTKALGELNDPKNLTFRNSIIGPDLSLKGIGLFNWYMKQSSQLKGYQNAIWTGVSTPVLARAIKKAIELNLSGLYNLVNNQTISKFELLKLFDKYFKNSTSEITPIQEPRIDKSLINNRTDFDFIVPSYEEMIQEMQNWVQNHKSLYPHYKNF